jgi:hypothetical protein
MVSEARKITAQFMNGLAVAATATFGGALAAGNATIAAAALAVLISLLLRVCAVWVV